MTRLQRQGAAEQQLESGLIDRSLRLEPSFEHLGDHLHLSLRLHEPAGNAEHVLQPTVARDRGRDGGVRRFGAGCRRQVERSQHRGPVADRAAELGYAEV